MPLRAEYHIGCEALPLVDVAGTVPDADIDLAISPGMNERPRFTARVVADEPTVAAVEDAFDQTPFVGEYTLVAREDGASRFTILPGTSLEEQFGDALDDLTDLRALYETPTHIELIRPTPTGWVQRGRFADRAAFDQLRTFWQRNAPFRLRHLSRVGPEADDRFTSGGDGLTDAQRAAVRTAHELGYFEIPRRASLDDVAAELDISASSCSERLRRAQSHLVETHVDGQARTRSTDRTDREHQPLLETPHD